MKLAAAITMAAVAEEGDLVPTPLDEGVHEHPSDDIDPRMEALRAFKPDRA